MKYRRLGRTSLEVPVVAFGAWAIGGGYWGGTDDETAAAAILHALDAGMTAIDTAPVYGFGHSERIVGRAIEGRRREVIVMTKAGLRWDDPGGQFFFESVGPNGGKVAVHANSRPESVRWEVEQSLRRLSLSRIDLLQIHWPDPTTPIADTMGALLELRTQGKIAEIGVSNYSPEQMEEARVALGDVPLASDQPKYNLLARGIETDVLPYVRQNEIGALTYSPLEQGLLTGSVSADRTFPPDDGRNKHPGFTPENRARVNGILSEVVAPVAEAHGASIAQISIAWLIAQPGVTSVLAGIRSPEQVLENAGASDVDLSVDELQRIGEAFQGLDVAFAPDPPKREKGLLKRFLRKS